MAMGEPTVADLVAAGIDLDRLHQVIEDRVRGEYAELVAAALAWHEPHLPRDHPDRHWRLFHAVVAFEQDDAWRRDGDDRGVGAATAARAGPDGRGGIDAPTLLALREVDDRTPAERTSAL